MRTLVWRRLDEPGMEIAHIESFESADFFVRAAERYEPRGDRVVGYSSGPFAADIEFDADGFVTLYHGFLERLS